MIVRDDVLVVDPHWQVGHGKIPVARLVLSCRDLKLLCGYRRFSRAIVIAWGCKIQIVL